jgi:hypothetical protein
METEKEEPSRFGLIIGAMKCGTTTLFNHLARHPQVAASRVKEPSFFCGEDYRPGGLARYRALWDWQPEVHRIAIEASANYTKRPRVPDCPERIAEFQRRGLDFRFVYCMRNPLDRITSHVYHGLYAGWTKPLEAEISDHTIDLSRYAMQLDPYVEHFGRDRIHLVVLEEFVQSPKRSLRRLCDFLEIDPSFDFPHLEVAHNRAEEHYLEHPLWERLRSIGGVRRVAQSVAPEIRRFVLRATGRRLEARRRLTGPERSKILAQLESDLARLRSDYGIDPETCWGLELR